jgi:transposase
MEFRDALDANGKLVSVTCRMFRKSRSHPTEVTEYMAECLRATDVWKNWPARMLRHKATIQAARYAFGFAGIYEPDEAERMNEVHTVQAVEAKLEIADERKLRHDDAADQFAESIQLIKSQIARHDEHGDPDALYTVAETWNGIPSAAQIDLWLAPSKGGIFTTHERDVIKTKLPKEPQA